jgi:hypothetical protein
VASAKKNTFKNGTEPVKLTIAHKNYKTDFGTMLKSIDREGFVPKKLNPPKFENATVDMWNKGIIWRNIIKF